MVEFRGISVCSNSERSPREKTIDCCPDGTPEITNMPSSAVVAARSVSDTDTVTPLPLFPSKSVTNPRTVEPPLVSSPPPVSTQAVNPNIQRMRVNRYMLSSDFSLLKSRIIMSSVRLHIYHTPSGSLSPIPVCAEIFLGPCPTLPGMHP